MIDRRNKEDSLMKLAKWYAKKHIGACKNWTHGGIADFWEDGAGNLCIQYEDGSWWHYQEDAGKLIRW